MMLQVLKYIKKNNNLRKIPKYLVNGLFYQIFKRCTNSIISKRLFNGKSIFLYPKCNVSSMFAYTEIPDRKEINLLREIAVNECNAVFLDIGANIGSYSVCMMDLCTKIIAFEPHPFTVQRCKMNFLLNGFSENCVQQLALSNNTGKVKFSDFGGSSTINHIVENNANGIEVEVTTIDNYIIKRFDIKDKFIVKVDVEGFEKQVFEGGTQFFKNYDIRGMIFECFKIEDIAELLNNYGFISIKKISENNYFASKI